LREGDKGTEGMKEERWRGMRNEYREKEEGNKCTIRKKEIKGRKRVRG
jgi:hypothetical protein